MCPSRVIIRLAEVCAFSLLLCNIASAAPIFQTTPSDQTVVDGGDATFSCDATLSGARRLLSYSVGNGAGARLQSVRGNITDLSLVNGVVGACVGGEFNSQLILKTVTREANGYTVTCSILDPDTWDFIQQTDPPATMSVISTPVYTLLPNQPTTVLEGEDFTYSFGFSANPTPTNFTWSRDGQVISNGGRTATSVSTITITSTTGSDSGVYEVVSYNEAGRGAANFTLDVQYPPELATPLSPTLLTTGTSFSFNCTPSAANPPIDTVSIEVDGSPATSGDTVTVTDNVLTIPSVQRSHCGNYSCTATNTRGSTVIYQYLLVADGVPLIARVAVQFVTSSSLEVVAHLTTNGGRDVLRYYIVLSGAVWVFSGGNQSVLSATVSGDPAHRGEVEGEERSVSVVVENELGNSSEIVVVLRSQPSSVSDSVRVGGVSSAVIGLSVTVAILTVISVIMIIISLTVIIVICQRQASYRLKAPSPKDGDYQLEDVKEVKLESNPAYEAVNTS